MVLGRMSIPVRDVYNRVCDILLEPGGLTGETITDAQFLRMLNDSLREFMEASSCYKKLNNIQALLGVRVYQHLDYLNQTYAMFSDQSNLFRSSGNYWDTSDWDWQKRSPGTPTEWRNDQLAEDKVEVRPSPAWNGYQVSVPNGFYGNFSQQSDVKTIEFSCDPSYVDGVLGAISSAHLGSCYLEVTAPMFGIPSSMVEATMNFTQVCTYTFENEIVSLDEYIPDIHYSFKPYVVFFVLAKAFSTDSEVKNANLVKYFKARANEFIRVARSVSQEILLEV